MPLYDLNAVPVLPPISKSDYFDPQPEWKKSLASHVDQLQAMGGGLMGAAGTAFGSPSLQEAGQEIYERNMDEAQSGWQKPAVGRVEDIKFSEPGGVGRALDWAANVVPGGLLTVGESLLGGLAGAGLAKVGVGTAVKNLAARKIEESVAKTAAGEAMAAESAAAAQTIGKRQLAGAVAGSSAVNTGMETGQSFGQMVQDGIKPEDALLPAVGYGLASSATELGPEYLAAKYLNLFGAFKNSARAAIAADAGLAARTVDLAKKVGKGAAAGVASEGAQEALQEYMQIVAERVAKNDSAFAALSAEDKSQILNSWAAGMAVGGLAGGVVGGMRPTEVAAPQPATAQTEMAQTEAPPATITDQEVTQPSTQQLPSTAQPTEAVVTPTEEIKVQPNETGTFDVIAPEGVVAQAVPTQVEAEQIKNEEIAARAAAKQIEEPQLPPVSIVNSIQPSTEVPNAESSQTTQEAEGQATEEKPAAEQFPIKEWDQAHPQQVVPQNENALWQQTGHELPVNEWSQVHPTTVVPENEVEFWRSQGVPLPGSVVRKDGKPFVSERSAQAALTRNKIDGQITPVEGGFAIQPWETKQEVPNATTTTEQSRSTEALATTSAANSQQDGGVKYGHWNNPQINTPEFHQWFGDSKVVGEDGTPQVVYHGTKTGGFTEFKGKYRKNEQLGFGLHFADDKDFATQYAEGENINRKGKQPQVYGVYLNIRHPLIANKLVTEGTPEFDLAKKLAGTRLFTQKNEEGLNQAWLQNAIDLTAPQRAERLIKEAGYDGVRYESRIVTTGIGGIRIDAKSPSWIVFNPTQIKSATDNQGTFNSSNPNIFHGEQQTPGTTTREALQSAAQSILGTTDNWRLHIYGTAEEAITAGIPAERLAGTSGQGAYGWVEQRDGKLHATLIAERIPVGGEMAALMHELGAHIGLESVLTKGQLQMLVKQIEAWAGQGRDAVEVQAAKAALRRVENAKTPEADRGAELIAYFLEESIKRGVNPTALQPNTVMGRWFRTLWAAFKRALRRLRIANLDKLTAQNVVDLAYGAARLELAGHWHGSAGAFRKFDSAYMSSGAGDQWYSWGHYIAKRKGIGEHYMEMVDRSEKKVLFGGKTKEELQSTSSLSPAGFWVLDDLDRGLKDDNESLEQTIVNLLAGYKAEKQQAELSRRLELVDQIHFLETNRNNLQRTQGTAQLHRVDVNVRPDEIMHWDKPLSEQPQRVQDAIKAQLVETDNSSEFQALLDKRTEIVAHYNAGKISAYERDVKIRPVDAALDSFVTTENSIEVPGIGRVAIGENPTGSELYQRIVAVEKGEEAFHYGKYNHVSSHAASMFLDSIGIKGMEHWDEPSRRKGEPKPELMFDGVPIFNVRQKLHEDPNYDLDAAEALTAVSDAYTKNNDLTAALESAKEKLGGWDGSEPTESEWLEANKHRFEVKTQPDTRSTNLVVFNDRNIHTVGRAPAGDLSQVRYGVSDWFTDPVTGDDALLHPPGWGDKLSYDYISSMRDLRKLAREIEAAFPRANAKRGSFLGEYFKDKTKPFVNTLADYLRKTEKGQEQFNLELAAQHIVLDKVNMQVAMANAKAYWQQLEKTLVALRAQLRSANSTDPEAAEMGRLLREFRKGEANLNENRPWGWDQAGAERNAKAQAKAAGVKDWQKFIPTPPSITSRNARYARMTHLDELFDAALPSGTEVWQLPEVHELRMTWEALKNHGAGMETADTASQRSAVRKDFLDWLDAKGSKPVDAHKYYNEVKGDAAFAVLTKMTQGVAADIRNIRVRGRLTTQEEADAMAMAYTHWVPLRRDSYDFEQLFKDGRGGTGRPILRAGSPNVDPPVHVFQNLFAAVDGAETAAESNLARIAFADDIRADLNKWKGWITEVTTEKDLIKRRDSQGNISDSRSVVSDSDIAFFEDGVLTYIKIEEANHRAQYLSKAIQNTESQEHGPLLKMMSHVNSYIRWTVISASPGFMLMNAPRDFGHGMLNLQAGPLAKYSKEVAGRYKECFVELFNHFVRNIKSPDILAFQRAGGMTGFVQALRPNDQGMGGLEWKVKASEKSKAYRFLRDGLHTLEDLNIAVENVMRLAVWKTAKAHQQELGLTDDQIGTLSEEITVNYNRRGLRTSSIGAYYMFFNASVQGAAGIVDAAMNGPNKARFLKTMGAVMVLALLNDLAGAAAGDDWDETPEYEKDRFMRMAGSNVMWGGEGGYVKMPMPWVFNVVWRAGEMAGEVLRGKMDLTRYAAKLVELTINSMNPVGANVQVAAPQGASSSVDFGLNGVMTTLAPTSLDWFVQIQTNKDVWGRPLGPEKMPGEKNKPESQMAWDNTPKFYKWLSQWVNSMTGGSAGEPGLMDWRPSTYKVLGELLTGGIGRFVEDIGVSIDQRKLTKFPVFKPFVVEPNDRVGVSMYHERQAQVAQAVAAEKALSEGPTKDLEELAALRAKSGAVLRLKALANDTERQVKDLRGQIREAQTRGLDGRVDALRERIRKVQNGFNQVWERRVPG